MSSQKTKTKNNPTHQFALFGVITFLFAALVGSLFVKDFSGLFSHQQANLIPAWEKIAVQASGDLDLDLSQAQIYQVPGKLPYIIIDGNTWIPVNGEPLELIILNDSSCGATCDPSNGLGLLRANISPAIVERTVEASSEEGKKLIADLDLDSAPSFIFSNSIESFTAEDGSSFLTNLQPGILSKIAVEDENFYRLEGAAIGLKPGKYLEAPEFADMDTEPTKGTGPVQVVEFTNYQCGYCGVLHNNINETVTQMIADNKITYTVKDFPAFGRNDVFAHRAANCVLREGGKDKYWEMNDQIFAKQSEWSQTEDGETYFNTLASELGVDVTACVNDPSIEAEIQADLAEGSAAGVNGTPALFIGKQIVPGAIAADYFETVVNQELGN